MILDVLSTMKAGFPGTKYPEYIWETLEKIKDSLVNVSNFGEALLNQISIQVYMVDLYSMVSRDVALMDSDLSNLASSIETAAREEAASSGVKMTNDAAKAKVQSDPAYQLAERNLVELKSFAALVQGYVFAAKDRGEIVRELSTNERNFNRANMPNR